MNWLLIQLYEIVFTFFFNKYIKNCVVFFCIPSPCQQKPAFICQKSISLLWEMTTYLIWHSSDTAAAITSSEKRIWQLYFLFTEQNNKRERFFEFYKAELLGSQESEFTCTVIMLLHVCGFSVTVDLLSMGTVAQSLLSDPLESLLSN